MPGFLDEGAIPSTSKFDQYLSSSINLELERYIYAKGKLVLVEKRDLDYDSFSSLKEFLIFPDSLKDLSR